MGKKEAGEVVSAVEKGKEAMKGGLNLSTSKDLKKGEKGVQRERERIGVCGSAGASHHTQFGKMVEWKRITYTRRDMGFVNKWGPPRG